MRRILTVILIMVAGLIAVSGLYFFLKTVYLAEQGIDFSQAPKLKNCTDTTIINVAADNGIYISDIRIEQVELVKALYELKKENADQCLLVRVNELANYRALVEMMENVEESGLSWNLVITSD